MAGRPKRRARLEQLDQYGRERITRHVPRVPDAEWRAMTDLQRIHVMFGMSEERVYAILSIPDEETDLHTRVLQVRIWEILLRFGQRLLERGAVEIEREEHMKKMMADFGRRQREAPPKLEGYPPRPPTPKLENGVGDG